MNNADYDAREVRIEGSKCELCARYNVTEKRCDILGAIPTNIWSGEEECEHFDDSVEELYKNLDEFSVEKQEICELRKEYRLPCFNCSLNGQCREYKEKKGK